MPPRSKPIKIEWSKCNVCDCKFSSKDQDKHASICSKQRSYSLKDLTHGCVKNGTLFAFTTKHNDAAAEHFPKQRRDEMLFVHPSTMNEAGFRLGDHICVNGRTVLTAWPSWSLPVTSVGINPQLIDNLKLSLNEIEIFWALPTPSECAKDVCVTCRNAKSRLPLQESAFAEFLTKHFEDKFLHRGEDLQLRYFGQPCELTVAEIKDNVRVSDNVEDATASLSDLSLDELAAEDKLKSAVQFYKVTKETKFKISDCESERSKAENSIISLSDVGGLSAQISAIQEIVDVYLKKSQSRKVKHCLMPKGILLHGPSGVGKSLLANAVAQSSGLPLIAVHGTEIWSKFYGESEAKLKSYFTQAGERAPCILLLEELDSLCPRRETSHNEVEKRVVASLLSLMDGIVRSDRVVLVLGTTSKRDDVDSALRLPGRFDREIELAVPSPAERTEILTCLLRKIPNDLSSEQVTSVAAQAHGFVGADLSAVCKEASFRKLRNSKGQHVSLSYEDLLNGLKLVKPSAMREVALEVPQVSWDDIGGQEDLKHKLSQAIEWPLKHPEAFRRFAVRPPKGLLMFGPPGCSKTMIAKALARESGVNFLAIKGPELFSKWVGESERAVRELFRKARSAAPAIIFFDEIDALTGERGSHGGGGGEVSDRVLAQLLTEMDGVDALQDVTVVAATNRPDRMDKALLRPGRLDRIVYVPLPDARTRTQIFTIQLKKSPTTGVDVGELVRRTEGYSGAEIAAVCHEAALSAMQEDRNIENIHKRHFEEALSAVKPRISAELIDFYESYAKNCGLHSL